MPRTTKRARRPAAFETFDARLYLTGQALQSLALDHRPGTNHHVDIGLDAVELADAALHALRLTPEEMRVAKRGAK